MSSILSSDECEKLIGCLVIAKSHGIIDEREEDNEYLIKSYLGLGDISEKWNVKIYDYNHKRGGHSVVTNDSHILDKIINKDFDGLIPTDRAVISIDDSGWGFPLGGVLVGASDGEKVITHEIPVKYFQGNGMESKEYLDIYSSLGQCLVIDFSASPETHRIEICTGFVNSRLKNDLREIGFEVSVVEIKGLLQDELESLHKEYIKELLGQDLYYDPKDMNTDDIPREYKKCVEFGRKNCPDLLKNGWKSLQ